MMDGDGCAFQGFKKLPSVINGVIIIVINQLLMQIQLFLSVIQMSPSF